MHIYGLTGGTASGKTEAARVFAERGIPVIDADKVGHEMLEADSPVYTELVALFGEDIDRDAIGAKVFADPHLLAKLNAIVHPAIRQRIMERCAALAQAGHAAAVIDAALLAESGKREPWLAGMVLVLAGKEARMRRLVETRGMDPEQARSRIMAQTPPEQKVPLADWIINNDGTLEELHQKAAEVADALLAGA